MTGKGFIRKASLLFAIAAGGAFAADNAAPIPPYHPDTALQPEVLTNEGVVALANAGFSDAFIMEKIRLTDRTRLDTSVAGLSYLRRNAITENLVLFILKQNAEPSTTANSAPTATPTVIPTVVKSKLKMKKIAVPMEAVNVIFVPAGSALANTSILTQGSSYSNPVPASPSIVKLPQMPVTNAAWWK